MSTIDITSQERNTILAALRTYQAAGYGEPCNRPLPIHDIATNLDCEISLNAEAIDELCEKINIDCNEYGSEKNDADSYEKRVRALEAEGMTRSDAQGIIDAEDFKL